jgi:hypothetical protein
MGTVSSAISYVAGNVVLRCTGFPWSTTALTVRSTVVGGSVRGFLGLGSNSTTLEAVTVQRDVLLTGAGQDDHATVRGTSIGGSATLRFGDGVNTVVFEANGPTVSRVDRGLRVFTGGDNDTVCQVAYLPRDSYDAKAWAPSYRQMVDMGDLSRSVMISPPGQSGQLGSPHYDDQIEPWLKGEYQPMLWTREQVEREAQGNLRLEPGDYSPAPAG